MLSDHDEVRFVLLYEVKKHVLQLQVVVTWKCSSGLGPSPSDLRTCSSAAENGHVGVLQWARSQEPPCPWDSTTCSYAARNDHLSVVKWARSQESEETIIDNNVIFEGLV
jgi:hypothetical protein